MTQDEHNVLLRLSTDIATLNALLKAHLEACDARHIRLDKTVEAHDTQIVAYRLWRARFGGIVAGAAAAGGSLGGIITLLLQRLLA